MHVQRRQYLSLFFPYWKNRDHKPLLTTPPFLSYCIFHKELIGTSMLPMSCGSLQVAFSLATPSPTTNRVKVMPGMETLKNQSSHDSSCRHGVSSTETHNSPHRKAPACSPGGWPWTHCRGICLKSSGQLIQKKGQGAKYRILKTISSNIFSTMLMSTHLLHLLVFTKPINCLKFLNKSVLTL